MSTMLNEFINKYGGIMINYNKADDTNTDNRYDYEIEIISSYKNKKYGICINYKNDDDFDMDELIDKVLEQFNNYYTNDIDKNIDNYFVYEIQ